MLSKKYYIGAVVVIFLSLVCVLYFPDFLFHPGDHLITIDADALKNYYTYLYYVNWDQSISMTGMAYPFGEHLVFTDTQPALAKLLSLINEYGIPIGIKESLAILHLFLIATFLISSILVYVLLTRMNLPLWYCGVIAVIISLMSPQLFRFFGHFALAVVFFIPLLWYLLLRQFESSTNYIWSILISILLLILAFLHPYYLPIGALMIITYVIVYYFQHRKKDVNVKLLIWLPVCAIMPMILFQGWLKWTDLVSDRPSSPYGLMSYRATFDSVFMPSVGPGYDFINYFITTKPSTEGHAFVGTICTLVLLFSLIRIYKWIRQKQYHRILKPALPLSLQAAIWVGVITLLIAMAFPFRLGLEWTLNFITPLKQFRSLGRFAWIFFYIFTIYTAYYLYQLYRLLSLRHKQFGVLFLGIALFSWASEAWIGFSFATKTMHTPMENVFVSDIGYTKALKDRGLTIDSFQAVVPLPFYFQGTEKIDVIDVPANNTSFITAYQTGLPLTSLMSARYSLSRGALLKQILAADEIEKEVLQYYPNQKPLLIIYSDKSPLNSSEQKLLDKCERIGRMKDATVYRLDLNRLHTRDSILEKYRRVKPDLVNHAGWWYASLSDAALIIPLEKTPFEKPLLGKGVFVAESDDEVLFDKQALPFVNSKDSIEYEISFWMYIDPKISEVTGFNLTLYNKKNEQTKYISVRQEQTYDMYKNWQRMSIRFKAMPGDPITLACSEEGITLDDILIRPFDLDIYKVLNDSTLYKNNYMIRMN